MHWPAGVRLADWTLAIVVFLCGFVIVEPAPYDLALVAVIVIWSIVGLRLNRHILPLIVLLTLYAVGGLLSLTQVTSFGEPALYLATTTFLAGSAIFFASVIVAAPDRRLNIINNAFLASAVVAALIGVFAYFELFPGAAWFKVSDRAAGPFQDPNVFGPFLALPAAVLARHILTHRPRQSVLQMLWFGIVAGAIFLAFSRAAWGLAVFSILATAFLAFCTQTGIRDRTRVIGFFIALAVAVGALLSVAMTFPGVSDLFEERAQLVQDYDGGRSGRFQRQLNGFAEIPDHPLGIGPSGFAKKFGSDEHNTWLKGFTVYGWIGGTAYIVLAIWTLAAAFPLLFKDRSWQPLIQASYVVFVGHLVIHLVIDNDHWRHLFLIYGILWGAIAAEKMRARSISRTGHERAVAPPRLPAPIVGRTPFPRAAIRSS